MPTREPTRDKTFAPSPATVLAPTDHEAKSVPIWIARDASWVRETPLSDAQRAWAAAAGFKGIGNKHLLIPDSDGSLAGIAFGIGEPRDPMARPELQLGMLAGALPPGLYHLASGVQDAELAGVAWGLGAYRFRRYKAENGGVPPPSAQLKLPSDASLYRVLATVEGVWLGRDLINTPAGDLGPQELEDAARILAERHGAGIASIVGEELIVRNFPMIHAVGRASTRPPRLIDLTWGRGDAPRVTLVGKGICFDTGGLDIKPASAMLLMKKDMGGAAAALALAHMIMANALDVRLRVLIPAAENSIAGNAFRPGDVVKSRAGKTVEIGNTDAEGRLVLADALALADEERPDTLVSFATLTGAARVALGPELPPLYTDDDAFAGALATAGLRVGDPVWRMPLWSGYEALLDSPVADMNNVSDSPFAGSVTAALFLRRFVKRARRFAHLDIYGWRPGPKPLGPKGAEVHAARAVFEVLRAERGQQ
ncbi:MAG: leucyl aminopeptidase family protein [Hyphomicrobiaceae bacterium]|nr:leucyl aminopeptidase family protein [Hyphomicrobiaceae bacterium]